MNRVRAWWTRPSLTAKQVVSLAWWVGVAYGAIMAAALTTTIHWWLR